jgi:poxvirus D5 protein-like
MKFSEKNTVFVKHKGSINVQGVKNVISFIVKELINLKCFLVCNGTFYLRNKNLLTAIIDRDVGGMIRCFLDDESRTEVSSANINEVVERLRDISDIQIDIDEIREKTKYKVLTLNGVFDVLTGKFNRKPPDNELFLYIVNFNYEKNATIEKAPNYSYFVKTSLGEENLECILEWKGYSCTIITDARKFMTFIGPEQCGKSLELDILEAGIGEENTSAVSFARLGTEQSRIKYQGKIANISREISAEPLKNEDAFKSLVAGEKITGRRLYENSREFKPYLKFIAASNFFPHFKHLDTALLDRIIPVYFKDRVSNDVKTDYELRDKILAEKDIIFSMALDRMPELIKSGYQFSMSDRAKTVLANKRQELLNVSAFIKETFELDSESIISSAHLYNLYKEWCGFNAIAPEGRNTFYGKVTDYSNQIGRGKFHFGNRNLNGFKGLKLKCNYNENMYEQSYQDSPVSTQKGEDAE